jgi:CBS domain-containing protein
MMKASELMKQNTLVFDADDSVYYVLRTLEQKNRREAPVTAMGKYLGMITLSDIARAVSRSRLIGKESLDLAMKVRGTSIRRYVKNPLFVRTYVFPEDSMEGVVSFFSRRNSECIPVVDRKKKLVGVVHGEDLRKAMFEELSLGLTTQSGVRRQRRAASVASVPSAVAIARPNGIGTYIDSILGYVNDRRSATADEVAKKFNISVQNVEAYAKSMELNGLMRVEYSVLGKMTLKKVES